MISSLSLCGKMGLHPTLVLRHVLFEVQLINSIIYSNHTPPVSTLPINQLNLALLIHNIMRTSISVYFCYLIMISHFWTRNSYFNTWHLQ